MSEELKIEKTDSEMSLEEIMKLQGTRKSEIPPWLSYAASMTEKLDPELEEEIKVYSEHVHQEGSNQDKEELHRQKEINREVSKEYQFLKPEEYENEDARKGKILHSSELITIFRTKCNLKCWYREHPQPDKLALIVQKDNEESEVGCWVQKGYMWEYSYVIFDDHDLPLQERNRGWRTVLLQLIIKGYLTKDLVEKVFGFATGPASKRYNTILYGFQKRTIKEE